MNIGRLRVSLIWLLLFSIVIPHAHAAKKIHYLHHKEPCFGPQIKATSWNVVKDAFWLHVNLFSLDTFKIITLTFPFFVSMRMIDERLQRCFYDEYRHRNRNQMPRWCHEIAQWSIALPIIFLGSNAFFSDNEDLRLTSQVFLVGMPFVVYGKDILKKFEFDACYRPWNEYFSCDRRSYGGFPSGHVAEAMYMAVLYGIRFGHKYALALGTLAAFVGVTFLTCNRHYISQLVAGAGFGTIYALAANKLIESKISQDVTLNLAMRNGAPEVKVAWRF